MTDAAFTPQLEVFNSNDNYLRSCSVADIEALGSDEYYSFSLLVQAAASFAWQEAYVRVDGGPRWRWSAGQLRAGQRVRLRISRENMRTCMTPGKHTVMWFFDGRVRCSADFTVTRATPWETAFRIPSGEEIARYQQKNQRRSPYLYADLHIPEDVRYTEYCVDFRALHLPKGTYCCLGCWSMDHSALEAQYTQIRRESMWAAGYAGFQRIASGQTVSIMSFWDLFCTDRLGRETVLSAKRLYPAQVIDGGRFSGEGTGERSSAPYAWEKNHWYRMHLKCIPSPHGTTVAEQWVTDLETGATTLLSRFDTRIPGTTFHGDMVAFLENYLPETAGEVRSMELCNARYLDAATGQWQAVTQAYICSQSGLPHYEGSYDFGVTDGHIWMLTSGVGGDWYNNGKGRKAATFSLL